MDKVLLGRQHRAAMSLLAQKLSMTESERMQIADIYPDFVIGKPYYAGFVFRHGKNEDGETQLYEVVQAHTSAAEWQPEANPALYKKIGFSDNGIPIWTQPLGATDAYEKGDKVDYNGKIYVSDADGNVWEPGVYGWTAVEE
jgi:hypothetical protein